jgi:hypothetical protein
MYKNSVHFKFTLSRNVGLWNTKQPEGGEHVSDIGVSNSTEENNGSRAVKRKVRKYQISCHSVLLIN